MDTGEIEEKLKDISRQIGYASGVIVGLHSNKVRPIIDELITEVARLRELVDSVTEVVEIFHPKSQAQEEWRREWLDKARTGRE